MENMYTVTALGWRADGSRLAVGSLCGSVDVYDACVKRTRCVRSEKDKNRRVCVRVCLPACESYLYSFPPSSAAVFHEGKRKGPLTRCVWPSHGLSFCMYAQAKRFRRLDARSMVQVDKQRKTYPPHTLSLPPLVLPTLIATALEKLSTNSPKTLVIVSPPTTLVLQVQGAL